MKKLSLLSLLLLIQLNSFSQNLRDKLSYKVTYELTYKIDSTDLGSEKSEYMILSTGDEISVFSSRAKTLANNYITNGFSGHTSKTALTAFHYVIVKNRQEGKMYYTLQIPKIPEDHFFYPQDLDLFEWEITPETKEIKGFQVQKATASFSGRNYIAWFTPDVPIPDGPYKFNGLPGLILEIADTEGDYVFSFIGLEKISPNVPFRINLNKLISTEKEELKELFYRYRSDPFTYANNPNVRIDPEVHKKYVESFTEKLERENNPLELK